MHYLFLQRDYTALCSRIDELRKKMNLAHEETAESTMQTSETWHDNFVFEEGQRQLAMLMQTIVELSNIANHAIVVEKKNEGLVEVGSIVTFQEVMTDKEQTVQIGSYMVFDGTAVSYASPLGQILLGAKEGDTREGKIGSVQKSFQILKVE